MKGEFSSPRGENAVRTSFLCNGSLYRFLFGYVSTLILCFGKGMKFVELP